MLPVAVWGDECGIATLPIERVPGDLEEHREVVEPERVGVELLQYLVRRLELLGPPEPGVDRVGSCLDRPVVFDRSTA